MSRAGAHGPGEITRHRGSAALLDEICREDERSLEARLVVRPGTAYSDRHGNLPSWAGPELMAQAISALSGLRTLRQHGQPAAIGLLLGVRSYRVTVEEFRPGEVLDVEVVASSEVEDGMAVFDGRIRRAGEVVATARLTVFQPPDDSFLQREGALDA